MPVYAWTQMGETMKKNHTALYLIAAIALIAVGFLASQLWERMSAPTVRMDTTTVTQQLERCQDLVTAKLEYRGLVTYEEGDIDFINKKGFTMIYDADVAASVDLSKAEVAVDGRSVSIKLPHAKLESVSIDPDSLKFYDEKFALFNWQNKTDTAEALKLADKDAESKVDKTALLKTADKQAKKVIASMFAPFTGEGGYEVAVAFAD